MGMFDHIRCEYPLPIDGLQDHNWQTKDTPSQNLDEYEIRADGTLWHENYDIEDRSDPTASGTDRFIGSATPINRRWEPVEFTGEIRFYDFDDKKLSRGWVEFSAYFVDGKLKQIHTICHEPASSPNKAV